MEKVAAYLVSPTEFPLGARQVSLMFKAASWSIVHTCWVASGMVDSLQHYGLQPSRLLCSWDSPDKYTGVGCHFLLWGIFPAQGLKVGLLHCWRILYPMNHQGCPTAIQCRAWHYFWVIPKACCRYIDWIISEISCISCIPEAFGHCLFHGVFRKAFHFL